MDRRLSCCALATVLLACGSGESERSGPALPPRPLVQTCLVGQSSLPNLLSETGCYSDLPTLEPAPDLIPYSLNAPLWTDGAYKIRHMMVPPGTFVAIADDGLWEFPDGSVLLKNFGFEFAAGDSDGRRIVETRVMVRRGGVWDFGTYRWNEQGTDAELLDKSVLDVLEIGAGDDRTELEYYFPNRDDCETCHGSGPGEILGPSTRQLNGTHDYQGLVENQLVALSEIGLFGDGVFVDPESEPHMGNPLEDVGTVEEQARAYLHANCAHCHKPGGWAATSTDIDLRYDVPLADTFLCGTMQYYRWAGMPRIEPGDAAGSGLFQRMQIEDIFRMPSLGSTIVDPLGSKIVAAWIDSLDACSAD